MEKIMSAIDVLSQEEKFIHVVDKFITHHHNSVNNNVFYKNFMFSSPGIIWSIFIHGRSIAIHVITLIILCRCLQESFQPWTQLCSGSLQTAIHCCIAWIHLWIIFQAIWTKQSIFMLICWLSMKRNALQALWLILRRAQWSGKDFDSGSSVYKEWDAEWWREMELAFPAGHNRVLKGRSHPVGVPPVVMALRWVYLSTTCQPSSVLTSVTAAVRFRYRQQLLHCIYSFYPILSRSHAFDRF